MFTGINNSYPLATEFCENSNDLINMLLYFNWFKYRFSTNPDSNSMMFSYVEFISFPFFRTFLNCFTRSSFSRSYVPKKQFLQNFSFIFSSFLQPSSFISNLFFTFLQPSISLLLLRVVSCLYPYLHLAKGYYWSAPSLLVGNEDQ